MDFKIISDPNQSLGNRVAASGSLILSAVTGTIAPNFGAFLVAGWFDNVPNSGLGNLFDGATAGKVGKTQQFTKPGGLGGANKAFDDAVGNVPIKDHGGGIRSATLPDGSTISVRPGSTQGSPTVQINPSSGKPIKIRFN